MRADTVTKDYLSDTEIFADVFNYYIYEGRQVIRPEQLVERDPAEIALPYGEDGAVVPVQKFRDVQKLYASMTDGELEYVLYGIESQARTHYAAAVKNNLYDALEYAGQVEEAARAHRRAMKRAQSAVEGEDGSTGGIRNTGAIIDTEESVGTGEPVSVGERKGTEGITSAGETGKKRPNSGEFLSGFWKDDKLIPSVTVMLYFSSDEWDGPLSLFDMMNVKDARIFSFMDNYHVRLIAPAQMSDDEIMKFQSSLREVFLFIKYSKDRENLDRILKADGTRFREMERRAADVIEAITNNGLEYNESEEKVDMCQAIQEMRMEERQIGERNGELKKAQEDAKNFYRLGVDIEKIAQGVGYAVETVKQWVKSEGKGV